MAQGSSEPSVPHPVPPEEPQICTCGTWQAALPCRAGGSSCWSGAAEPPSAGGSCAPAPADIPSGPARSGSCSSSGHPHTCKTNPVRAERHPCYSTKTSILSPWDHREYLLSCFFGNRGSAEPPAVQGARRGCHISNFQSDNSFFIVIYSPATLILSEETWKAHFHRATSSPRGFKDG